jgi:hypothetical protein
MSDNKLIAEFMGATLHKNGTYQHCSMPLYVNPENMLYSSSWDWLMPVVEKIDQIGASVIIGRMFCEIGYTDPLDESKVFDVRMASGVKFNAVSGAVLDFIKWHNINYKNLPPQFEWEYTCSTDVIWTDFDYGRVVAGTREEAIEKAKAEINKNLEKANAILNGEFSISINVDELTVEKSNNVSNQ